LAGAGRGGRGGAMRVLQVDSGRDWRGGQNQVWLLCQELAPQSDVTLALVTKQGSELAQRAAADGIEVLGTAWDIGLDPRAWWHLRGSRPMSQAVPSTSMPS